jgi:hypothetical protein
VLLLGVLAGIQQRDAVVENKADQLLALADDLQVAQAAGLRQGKMVVFGMFHQMQHLLQAGPRLCRLSLQTLRQDHRQDFMSARIAPRMTAKLVPMAPEVRI